MASAIKIIAGLFILLIGFPIFIGGSAILLVIPIFTDSQGYFMTNSIHIDEDDYAALRVDIPLEDVQIGVRIDPSRFVTLKMKAHGESTNDKVFVGLAKKSDIDEALTSISYITLQNFEFYSGWELGDEGEGELVMELLFKQNTTARALPDLDAVSWIQNTGVEGTEFIWAPTYEEVTSGETLSLVLINEDPVVDDPAVDITFSVGAKIPIINAIGWVLLIFGGLFTLLGIILVWSGLRTKRPRTERVRYYQGVPATRVEAVAKAPPKFQLQCSNCGALGEDDSSFCSRCGEVLLSEDKKTVEDVAKRTDVEIYEPTAAGHKLVVAEGWPRFWAWLIDIVIVGMVTSTLSSMFFFAFSNWDWWSFGVWSPFQWLVSIGPSSLLFFAYCVLMEFNYGQTIGKMILNLEVVSERSGEKPTIGEIALSALGKSLFLPIDVILGWFAREESQIPNLEQRFTQKMSKTVVILQQKEKEESPTFVSGRV